MNPRIKSAKPIDDYQLLLEFTNGELGFYDCKPLLGFGVFKELQDIVYFKKVAVLDGTVSWPNGQDVCPDNLYLETENMGKLIFEYPLKLPVNSSVKIVYLTISLNSEEFRLLYEKINASNFLKQENNQLIVKSDFFKKVPDKWRCNLIKCSSGQWQFTKPNGQPISNCRSSGSFVHDDLDIEPNGTDQSPVILLILESPHKEEYSKDGFFSPLSPANGDTGVNFEKYFISHILPILFTFGLKLVSEKYKIFFVNPIPFQTSLYEIHKATKLPTGLKEKVWNALYPECESDFIERMKSYNPTIILNGCTKSGGIKNKVKNSIDKEFLNLKNDSDKFAVSHPSSWNTLVEKW